MLEVKGAGFIYENTEKSGFTGIDFFLKEGEVLSILGPNGCGKTTLLKCLTGLLKLQQGEISLNGKSLHHLTRKQIARLVGYVPQLHQPAFPFSVMDAVLVGRTPYLGLTEMPRKEDIQIAEKAIETLNISHLKEKAYTQLSGGERQLVIFARVMAQQAKLLLLDEPTSHLDFGNQVRILHMVEGLAASGLPIVMTSHFPDHAFLISTKVAIMKEGRFVAFGTPDEVITEKNLHEIYGINVKIMEVKDHCTCRKVCVPL